MKTLSIEQNENIGDNLPLSHGTHSRAKRFELIVKSLFGKRISPNDILETYHKLRLVTVRNIYIVTPVFIPDSNKHYKAPETGAIIIGYCLHDINLSRDIEIICNSIIENDIGQVISVLVDNQLYELDRANDK